MEVIGGEFLDGLVQIVRGLVVEVLGLLLMELLLGELSVGLFVGEKTGGFADEVAMGLELGLHGIEKGFYFGI
jgi:hypothetical protein